MAALQSAFAALGPQGFSDIPTSEDGLAQWLTDLFEKCALIVESVPPPPSPEDAKARARSRTEASIASSASEISLSSARSEPPRSEWQELQKQWGKPIKLNAKDNPLGMSVYKTAGKDSRGAWFARRSVHEGLSFGRWKKAFEQEFPESLAAGDKPGEGNIRGIGGEKRVEEKHIEGKGNLEVYQLSAQFPGPTTPRDFITLLVTSSNALKDSGKDRLGPRHYMIISKPCIHDECPPRNNYIRGQYESVEFIREIPRQKRSLSSSSNEINEKDMLRSSDRKSQTFPLHHENHSSDEIAKHRHGHLVPEGSEEPQATTRSRSKTVNAPPSAEDESESNPVEWIMITRSDPGGSVPRFMVERGTPASICGDAVKFLDWATQKNHPSEGDTTGEELQRRPSLPSWETNGILSGVNVPGQEDQGIQDVTGQERSGILTSVAGAVQNGLDTYAPQIVLDHLPGQSHPTSQAADQGKGLQKEDDAKSTMSSLTFASAESHVSSASNSSKISESSPIQNNEASQHSKELKKLHEKKLSLDARLESAREKAAQEVASASANQAEAQKKATERQERELKKQEERHKKEVAKIEARKEKETKKYEQRKKKAEEKDLNKHNQTLKKELDAMKMEREDLYKIVEDLQGENTKLTAKLGNIGKAVEASQSEASLSSIPAGNTGSDDNKGTRRSRSPDEGKISKDLVRQLIEEDGKGKKSGRFRGISVSSRGSRGSGSGGSGSGK
ncbi:putative reticulocyte-binding protein 2 [Phaeomoniella chlamydospora]|uniref:Putative reticulocyte-binding protein 2 n=1 Tax=Phaeomoniella chlamydospora TaxID=158046 RepID=A0A0G2E5A9_PHACM|nr:putative reticulocyte-binding protein 2 [Phaeomoniella chlamydospora]